MRTSSARGGERVVALRYLLDTNIVSFHIRESSTPLQRRLRRIPASQVGLSVVTEMEIRYGLAKHPSVRIGPLVEQFLSGITILPLTSEVSRVYATVRVALDRQGTPIGPLDLMIAAHAMAVDVTLITNNTAEFERVPGLRCKDWTR